MTKATSGAACLYLKGMMENIPVDVSSGQDSRFPEHWQKIWVKQSKQDDTYKSRQIEMQTLCSKRKCGGQGGASQGVLGKTHHQK